MQIIIQLIVFYSATFLVKGITVSPDHGFRNSSADIKVTNETERYRRLIPYEPSYLPLNNYQNSQEYNVVPLQQQSPNVIRFYQERNALQNNQQYSNENNQPLQIYRGTQNKLVSQAQRQRPVAAAQNQNPLYKMPFIRSKYKDIRTTNNKYTPFRSSNKLPGYFLPMVSDSEESSYPDESDLYYEKQRNIVSTPRPFIVSQSNRVIQNADYPNELEIFTIFSTKPKQYQENGNQQFKLKGQPQRIVNKPITQKLIAKNQRPLIVHNGNYGGFYPHPSNNHPKSSTQLLARPTPVYTNLVHSIDYEKPSSFKTNQGQKYIVVTSAPAQHHEETLTTFHPPLANVKPNYYYTNQKKIPSNTNANVSPSPTPVIISVPDIQEINVDEETEVIQPKYRPPIVEYTTSQGEQQVPVTSPKPVTQIMNPSQTPIHEEPLINFNSGSLSDILKKLQDSNQLPKTLTPDNIDDSIRTLVMLLNNLKQNQKLPDIPTQHFPIEEQHNDYDYDYDYQSGDAIPNMGRPGEDYPIYHTIPKTEFTCTEQRYKGFFGDPETRCQVWHYCDLNGGKASFLCPNGTIFSQVALTCDWWFNVKCATTAQLYVLNERLYKFILPFTPKFPEDYNGPLVDKYLAIKFQQMEEKLQKQRAKGKDKSKAEDQNQSEELNEEGGDSSIDSYSSTNVPTVADATEVISTTSPPHIDTTESDSSVETQKLDVIEIKPIGNSGHLDRSFS